MFKKGDKVKMLSIGTANTRIGEIYEVFGNDDELIIISTDTNNLGKVYPERLELVEPKIITNEQLLEIANKGQEALKQLLDRNIKLESMYLNESWNEVSGAAQSIRIVKKEFKSFVIGKNWNVRFDNDKFKIGCQDFNIDLLKKDLWALICDNTSVGHNYKLSASKIGIIYDDYLLSWEDSEKLYKALKEYYV